MGVVDAVMGDAKSEPESTAAEDNFQQQFFKNFGAASALEGQAGRFSYFINTQHPPVSGSQDLMEEDKSGRQSPVVSPLLQYPPVYHGQRLCGQFGCGAPGYHNGYNPWAYGHPAAAPWSRFGGYPGYFGNFGGAGYFPGYGLNPWYPTFVPPPTNIPAQTKTE